jgi:hypothetical protein
MKKILAVDFIKNPPFSSFLPSYRRQPPERSGPNAFSKKKTPSLSGNRVFFCFLPITMKGLAPRKQNPGKGKYVLSRLYKYIDKYYRIVKV